MTPDRTTNPTPAQVTTPIAADRQASEDVRRARVWLVHAAEPGSPAIYRWVEQVGPVEAVERIRAGRAPAELDTALHRRVFDDRLAADWTQAVLSRTEQHGLRLLVPEDPNWPHKRLAAIPGDADARPDPSTDPSACPGAGGVGGWPGLVPPLALWVRGTAGLDQLTRAAVAVTGARAATAYGHHVATDLAYRLARAGRIVVAGGAYGIDTSALRGALVADRPTLAVLPSGLAPAHPAGNVEVFDRICERGLLVSELPPGAVATRRRHQRRNQLLAALTAGIVIVEAPPRSSVLDTARIAHRLGRVVMTVPGPVTSAASAGCHHLARQPFTRLVTTAAEILAELDEPDSQA